MLIQPGKGWTHYKTLITWLQDLYRQLARPWIIAYSGGKDSTLVTHLIWLALQGLLLEERRWPVFVLSNDTLVEDPAIHVRQVLSIQKMNAAAQAQGLPLTAQLLVPALENRFWYKLLGQGYAAPTVKFRWCTRVMKIEPNVTFVREIVAKSGPVAIFLGTREEESDNRRATMRNLALPGTLKLYKHPVLGNDAVTCAPCADWTLDDLWTLLLASRCPWSPEPEYANLFRLYQQADPGECQIVLSSNTPSCGGNRNGCWLCPVVIRNKSMASRLEHGEAWLRPLLDFRELLKATTDPAKKTLYRSIRGPQGDMKAIKGKRKPSPRRYTLEFRKTLLRELLLTQQRVRELGPDPLMELISVEELRAIRRLWKEEGDLEDAVSRIWREITQTETPWFEEELMEAAAFPFDPITEQLALQICQEEGIPLELMRKLIAAEQLYAGDEMRLMERVDEVLSIDYRPDEEVWAEVLAEEDRKEALPKQLPLWDKAARASRRKRT